MITVLMPTYNCAEYISDAIRSILNQTYKNFEFLIIDDGSTDETEKIIHKFNDERINYVKKKHTSLADTLNYGLKQAKYETIARMDADDISLPWRLEQQLAVFNKCKTKTILSSSYCLFTLDRILFHVKSANTDEEIKRRLILHSSLCHPAMMYNKNEIINIGGYKNTVFEDYELLLRIRDDFEFMNLSEVLYLQRFRTNSFSRDNLIINHSIHYVIQSNHFQDLSKSFRIQNPKTVNEYIGWREYFYGDRDKARTLWYSTIPSRDYRIYFAILVTFLPKKLFLRFKEARIRFRIEYFVKYFSEENKNLRKFLRNFNRDSFRRSIQ